MRLFSCLILVILACLNAQSVSATPKTIQAVASALSYWDTHRARSLLESLPPETLTTDQVVVLSARLLYLEGNYEAALGMVENLPDEIRTETQIAALIEQIQETSETLRPFSEFLTSDGRFLIRYLGKDKLLLPFLTEVLKNAEQALSEDFGFEPPSPIIVEVYPTVDYLAKVSSLTLEALETSGTIALCSDNRLMLTSPRGVARGYGWMDTLAHEFVHYYVTKVSRNTVPIWLHEGIAKFQETRWRSAPGHPLDPPQEDLLARSLKKEQLVTFEQMHPSMALLPSQQATALAFAEVHSTIEYLYAQGGYGKLRGLLRRLSTGDKMDRALKDTYGVNLKGLWKNWVKRVKQQNLKTYPGLVHVPLDFKRPGVDEEDIEAELMTIEAKEVRDFAHLGELLRARSRYKAALKEYQKAIRLNGPGNPAIQNGAASALLALDRADEIPAMMDKVKLYYPTHLNTFLNLGRAYLKLADWFRAKEALERALGINPFHPEVQKGLIRAYTELDMKIEAKRSQKAMEIISQ